MPLILCTIGNVWLLVYSKHEIAFCYTIMEENKRVMLPTMIPSSSFTSKLAPLECFFPLILLLETVSD